VNKALFRLRRFLLLAFLLIAPVAAPGDALDRNFSRPPDSARPWVYWYFMDGMMTREGLTADLEAMKRAGIGGAIFLEVNIGLPRGPVEFMSTQWQELFRHACKEADRLGIEIALGAGPGWCGTGGPWVAPDQSMQHLVASETNVTGPLRFNAALPRPQPRIPYFGEGTLTPELRAEWQNFYRDVALLAFPTPSGHARIGDADEKALYYRDPFSSKPGVKPFLPSLAKYPSVPQDECIPAGAVDLSSKLSSEGRLEWDVPPGQWTIMRFGRTITGQTTRPAPVPGLGFESDKLNTAALDAHFAAFIGKLLPGLAPLHPHRGLTTVHFDSWEMGSQNWSPDFRAQFKSHRGYDPLPFLPGYVGRVVQSPEITERFLWDVRETIGELVVENHARHLRELAHQHGLQLSIEPYDLNPAGDLELGAEADVPMCEFWADGDPFNTTYSSIEASSIAHTHGKAVVGAESFTGGKVPWMKFPRLLKNQADWAFAAGINRLTFHRYQHQPWTNRAPGLTMASYGTQYERTLTWWEMSGAWHEYLSRCQYLLRQGLPVADILYLTPEGAPNVFRPPPSALAGTAILPDRKGYNFDGIDGRTLMKDAQVRRGCIVLPDGMSYRVLVLPAMETMTPALLAKLVALKAAGATIIGPPPQKSPSLSDYPQADETVKKLAAQLWPDNPPAAQEKDAFTSPFPDYDSVVQQITAPPDFASDEPLRFHHRHLKNAEIYFVSNPSHEPRKCDCYFRIDDKYPELWHPVTGKMRLLPDFKFTTDRRTAIPLQFDGDESYFVVFRKPCREAVPQAVGENFLAVKTTTAIEGPWEIEFQSGRGAPNRMTMAHLASWSEQEDKGVKYFSGEADYHRMLFIDPSQLKAGQPLFLDLGRVEVMAQVTLNGHKFDTLWCAPYRVDISSAARVGENTLEIRVANLWPNRLIGDEQLPPDTTRNGGLVSAWPQWLLDGTPSPAGRIAWAAYDPFRADSPLLPSGLLGPVTLGTTAFP
jgi:hypothetical protein